MQAGQPLHEAQVNTSFWGFCQAVLQNPALALTSLLTLGVMFVNGWTDAPNAIATCVTTRSMPPRAAIGMAAIMNLLGLVLSTAVQPLVTATIYNMVDFGSDARSASIALGAAMLSIVIWAVLAWRFGIPTSESHALIAGLTGAAVALRHSFAAVNAIEWRKVLWGLALSAVLGFAGGFLGGKGVAHASARLPRMQANRWFRAGQAGTAAASAFMHGAQDGQKFIGVFLLGISFARGGTGGSFHIPLWLMLLCAAAIGLGTGLGGYRIIKAVGRDMVRLEPHEGFASDLAASGCLLLSSAIGLPVSTTHTKTTAMMGVGAARRWRSVNWSKALEMVLAWVFTFPGCALLSWGCCLLVLRWWS